MIELVPDVISDMAKQVLGNCVKGTHYYGGFLMTDISALKHWIAYAETDLDDHYRKGHPALLHFRNQAQGRF